MSNEATIKCMDAALPILIEHVRHSPGGAECLKQWDLARRTQDQIDADAAKERVARMGV